MGKKEKNPWNEVSQTAFLRENACVVKRIRLVETRSLSLLCRPLFFARSLPSRSLVGGNGGGVWGEWVVSVDRCVEIVFCWRFWIQIRHSAKLVLCNIAFFLEFCIFMRYCKGVFPQIVDNLCFLFIIGKNIYKTSGIEVVINNLLNWQTLFTRIWPEKRRLTRFRSRETQSRWRI